jgi:hypothetical protein
VAGAGEVPRERAKSREERAFSVFERVSTDALRFGAKIRDFWFHKVLRQEPGDDPASEEQAREKFRRLICCVFREEVFEEFFSMVQALGYAELGGFEHLGRRDCDHSMAADYDRKHRLHMRVYKLHGLVYVLVHHEPKATEDIGLHIKGFIERVTKTKPGQESHAKPPGDDANHDEALIELSDYERGRDLFIEQIRTRVPNFFRKMQVDLDHDALTIWTKYMGEIDHVPMQELLRENLIKSSRVVPAFANIRGTAEKIFQVMGFATEPAWDLTVPASPHNFLARAPGDLNYSLVVFCDTIYEPMLMRATALLRTKYSPTQVVVVAADLEIFGPGPEDVPPESVPVPEYNAREVQDFLGFLADAGVVIIPASLLAEVYTRVVGNRYTLRDLMILWGKEGLVAPEEIDAAAITQREVQNFVAQSLRIHDLVKASGGDWSSTKSLRKQIKKQAMEVSDDFLAECLSFLENPLVELIESREGNRNEFRAVEHPAPDETRRRQKLTQLLEQYYFVDAGKNRTGFTVTNQR